MTGAKAGIAAEAEAWSFGVVEKERALGGAAIAARERGVAPVAAFEAFIGIPAFDGGIARTCAQTARPQVMTSAASRTSLAVMTGG